MFLSDFAHELKWLLVQVLPTANTSTRTVFTLSILLVDCQVVSVNRYDTNLMQRYTHECEW